MPSPTYAAVLISVPVVWPWVLMATLGISALTASIGVLTATERFPATGLTLLVVEFALLEEQPCIAIIYSFSEMEIHLV